MRTLLIYPPLTSHPADVPVLETPLGLAYIAAFVEQNGYEVKILDAVAEGCTNIVVNEEKVRVGLNESDIKDYLHDYAPNIVGISAAYSALSDDSHAVAKWVKQVNPETKVIFGGAHASALPHLVLQDPNVDMVVKGEGELTFLDILKHIDRNEDISYISGTVVREGDGIRHNEPRPYITDLDSLPLPARHLLPMDKYAKKPPFMREYSMRKPRFSMITSRGCRMACVFCSIHSVWGNQWRGRSATKVVDEIEILTKQYQAREIAFMDDNLSWDRKRLLAILSEIQKRKLNIRWCTPNGIAIWTLDENILKAMKDAGCWKVTFGIESGCPETQKFIGKKIDLGRANRLIKYANKIGLWTHSTFVIGFPYEPKESIKQTVDFAVASDLDIAVFFIATPYPGTKLYDIFDREGLLLHQEGYWSIVRPAWKTKYFTKEELERLHIQATNRFHISRVFKFLNPIRLLRKVHSYEDAKYVFKMAKALISVQIKARTLGRIQTHFK